MPAETKPAPRRRPNFVGAYTVLCNGREVSSVAITREWTSGGNRHTATLADGHSVTANDGAYALHVALGMVSGGEEVVPWYPGCVEQGHWRVKALGEAPWTVRENEEAT